MRSKEVHTTTGSTKVIQQEDSGEKTRLGIRDQVKLERHRGGSLLRVYSIYMSRSESESGYEGEMINKAKYSTGSKKHD